MVKWAAATTVAAVGAFCAGFLFACICTADGLRSGQLDDVVDEMRRRR
jgi:hypothetical protein